MAGREKPKLFVSLAKLNRAEWSRDTTCGVSASAIELVLRTCVAEETGDFVGAHVALFFSSPTQEMLRLNALVGYEGKGAFWVDVLANGQHRISYLDGDEGGWFRKWEEIEVELYAVLNMSDGQIRAVHRSAIDVVRRRLPYDPSKNVNALFPCWCIPCGACFIDDCCALCATGRVVCGNGVTCVSVVESSLSAARGGRALGLPWRPVSGGFLPSRFVRELIRAGIVSGSATPLVRFRSQRALELPLIVASSIFRG